MSHGLAVPVTVEPVPAVTVLATSKIKICPGSPLSVSVPLFAKRGAPNVNE